MTGPTLHFITSKSPKGGRKFQWGFRDWIGAAVAVLVICFVGVVVWWLIDGGKPADALSAIANFAVDLVHGRGNSN